MNKRIHRLSLILFLVARTGGCASCQQEFAVSARKAVVVEYDHLMSFRTFRFSTGSLTDGGLILYQPSDGAVTGFWAVFMICSINNINPGAETFVYNPERWYVDYQGQRWYYRPTLPQSKYSLYAWGSAHPGQRITHSLIPEVQHGELSRQFRAEAILGPKSQQFPKGVYVDVPYRIAIFVGQRNYLPGRPEANLTLSYDGYPVVTEKRTDDIPVFNDGVEVDTYGLRSTCRPPD